MTMFETIKRRVGQVVRTKRFEANLAQGDGQEAVRIGRRLGKSPTEIERAARERVANLIDAGAYEAAQRLVDFFGFETEQRWLDDVQHTDDPAAAQGAREAAQDVTAVAAGVAT